MSKPALLIVDDEPTNIRLLVGVLKADYDLLVATGGQQALDLLQERHAEIDLILLDVNMPGMSGIEVLEAINRHADWTEIPVIFVTAMNQEGDEAEGLQLGAVDYITKPFSAAIVRARINTQLTLRRAKQALAAQNRILEQKVRERTEEISYTQEVIINALTSLAETRDNETGSHILRTQHYVRILANLARHRSTFNRELDNDLTIDAIFRTAPLHDVGKVGIPDHILLKPGKLDESEWQIMKTHSTLGGDALRKAGEALGGRGASFLRYAQEIAYHHHEKWDGSGYPAGLSGSTIPLSARLMAIADVYDALISKRCYKSAMTHTKALEILADGKGRHFDPDLLQLFLDHDQLFLSVADQYSDRESGTH